MRGLLAYLVGPGRANEHTEPRLVGGDAAIMAWWDDSELDRAAAVEIARAVDRPRVALGVEVSRGNVWHCSLSLRADSGQLTDEQWSAIAQDYMDTLGFTAASGKTPARWVAVRHGLSKAGNDHIHIAASWVREDGTKMFIRNDYALAQKTCRELERKYNLPTLDSTALGVGSKGYSQADAQISERQQRSEPRRVGLARQIRACAVASMDEAEFVRRVRQHSMLIRPRFAAGGQDQVVGFSVAAKPGPGERPAWFSGFNLSRDLSLVKLRTEWIDDPEHRQAAVREWQAAWRGRRPVAPGLERDVLDDALWRDRIEDLSRLREGLRAVEPGDFATWAAVARHTAAACAAWSMRTEPTPGPLADTARQLERYADLARPQSGSGPSRRPGLVSLSVTTAWLLQVGGEGSSAMVTALLVRQVGNLLRAMHDAHEARSELGAAADMQRVARQTLADLRAQAEHVLDIESVNAADSASRPAARDLASPIPTPVVRGHGVGQAGTTAVNRESRSV